MIYVYRTETTFCVLLLFDTSWSVSMSSQVFTYFLKLYLICFNFFKVSICSNFHTRIDRNYTICFAARARYRHAQRADARTVRSHQEMLYNKGGYDAYFDRFKLIISSFFMVRHISMGTHLILVGTSGTLRDQN